MDLDSAGPTQNFRAVALSTPHQSNKFGAKKKRKKKKKETKSVLRPIGIILSSLDLGVADQNQDFRLMILTRVKSWVEYLSFGR